VFRATDLSDIAEVLDLGVLREIESSLTAFEHEPTPRHARSAEDELLLVRALIATATCAADDDTDDLPARAAA
jgi:hypothetical protein